MAETLFGEGAGGGGMLINPVCAVKSLVVRKEMDDDVRAVKSSRLKSVGGVFCTVLNSYLHFVVRVDTEPAAVNL